MIYLRSLMLRADIIGLQEVHGTVSAMEELFKDMPGWLHFVSAAPSPAAGGVAILVNRCITDKARSVLPQVLLPGRGLRPLLQLEGYCMNILCLASMLNPPPRELSNKTSS
jgi:exonuclease III